MPLEPGTAGAFAPQTTYPRELAAGIKMPQAGSIFGYSQLPVDYSRGHILRAARIKIRRLTSTDAIAYRDIRLAGLKDSPEAFGSTFDRENSQPLTWFCDRLSNSAVFGAFRSTALLGVAGLAIRQGEKERHKGLLWGMYVRPSARKAGVGRQLVEAVIDHARAHVEVIQLSVIRDNEPAQRLYGCLGFVEYGIEKDSLKQNGRYHDEILMALDLRLDSDRQALPAQHTEVALREEEFAK